jgi:ectoine hydroxylase-related dioxygenase (phytanoyl-CoA dioxygenase family)
MSSSLTAEVSSIDAETVAAFARDGAVRLKGALSPDTLALAQEAFEWSLANPGPGAASLPSKGSGTFYQDLANPAALSVYEPLVRQTEIGDIVAALWQKPDVWFMYEQVFEKHGGVTRRTPWHQDAPYLPVRGRHLAVMWISFDPVSSDQALEFVRGSHEGPIYDGSRFDPQDDTLPLYGDGSYPRLPDIEAERDRWPVLSWPTEPGDVLVFHPAVLHGGGATGPSGRRRTLSLRFFGEDAVVAWRPGMRTSARQGGGSEEGAGAQENAARRGADDVDGAVHPLTRMRGLADGAPFRDPAFPRVRPRTRA